MADFCQLFLPCSDKTEADKISSVLLKKRLVACAKQFSVQSDFQWRGTIENEHEIVLVMESRLDLFDEIEKTVNELHSYDTFVLEATPIIRVSKRAEAWLNESLRDG